MVNFARRLFYFAGLALAAGPPISAVAQPASAVPVTVTTASKQDVPIWLRGLGTVQAYYAVQLRPRVDGTLMQVPVAEGQDVKQGALLAVIDPRPYQATLDTAMAKKQQDEAQLSNAKADLARYDSLVRRDFASRQQLDTQQAMVKQYTAALLGDEAQIEAARLNLSFCYITSPFDGRIGLRNVDPGQHGAFSRADADRLGYPDPADHGHLSRCRRTTCRQLCRRWRRIRSTSWPMTVTTRPNSTAASC